MPLLNDLLAATNNSSNIEEIKQQLNLLRADAELETYKGLLKCIQLFEDEISKLIKFPSISGDSNQITQAEIIFPDIELPSGASPEDLRNAEFLLKLFIEHLARLESTDSSRNIEMGEPKGNNLTIKQARWASGKIKIAPAIKRLPRRYHFPTLNPNYVERTETGEAREGEARKGLHESIKEYFTSMQGQLLVITAHGLGGVGKTQLIISYVHRYWDDYSGVCWFSAETREELIQEYVMLGKELRLFTEEEKQTSQEQLADRVKTWLEQPDRAGWLLVYDNAENEKTLGRLLPSTGGKILITSRHTFWPWACLPIGVYSLEEARSYFEKVTGQEWNDKAIGLIEALGRLPLALAQACHYIKRNRKSVEVYLQQYQAEKIKMLSKNLSPEIEQHEPVAVTWNITMEAMAAECSLSVELLKLCCYLHNEAIPCELVQQFFTQEELSVTEMTIDDAIRVAVEYSMLTRNEQTNTLYLHNLVQEVIKGQNIEKQRIYLNKAAQGLINYYPYGKDQLKDYALKRLLLLHVKAIYTQQSALQNTGVDTRNFLNILIRLSDAYGVLGDARAQKALLKRALVIQEAHYGKDHIEVTTTLVDLGNVYGGLGNASKQKALLERALVIQKTHYGKDHPVVAVTLVNLGNAYGTLGDASKKRTFLEQALVIIEAHYGKGHPMAANTLVNLGNAYGALGDANKQKALLERALGIQETHYGKNHSVVAVTLTGFGTAYGNLGEAREKKALLERALVIQEAHYGKDHPVVAITLTNLGNAYGDLGDTREKKALLERALVIDEAYYGKDHSKVAITLMNLGNAYGALGDAKEKKALLEQALVIQETHYGKDHIEVGRTLGNLGNAYGALGNASKRKVLLERALEILEAHYGKDHSEVALTLFNLGNAYGDLGNAREKKTFLERALVILEAYYGKDHPVVAAVLTGLGNAYGVLGDIRKKKALLEQALVIQEAYYGPGHFEVLITLVNLGNAYGDLGDTREEKTFLERALVIKEAHYGKDHPEVGVTLFNLAICYLTQKELDLANRYMTKAHDIFNTHPNCGPQHSYTLKAANELSVLKEVLNRESSRSLAENSTLFSHSLFGYEQTNLMQSTTLSTIQISAEESSDSSSDEKEERVSCVIC